MLKRGINVVFPACSPVNSCTSSTRLFVLVTTPQEPLQTPSSGLRFLKITTGHPIFNFNLCRGIPEQLIEFRYSTRYISCPSPFSSFSLIESALRNSISSPENSESIFSLISSTSSFLLVKMVLSAKYLSGG
jgi:hypothetical protein